MFLTTNVCPRVVPQVLLAAADADRCDESGIKKVEKKEEGGPSV